MVCLSVSYADPVEGEKSQAVVFCCVHGIKDLIYPLSF